MEREKLGFLAVTMLAIQLYHVMQYSTKSLASASLIRGALLLDAVEAANEGIVVQYHVGRFYGEWIGLWCLALVKSMCLNTYFFSLKLWHAHN
jgi:hypothetical protein